MSARINLTSPDETAALQWVDITRENGIKRLNIALTIPSRFAANRYTDPSDFELKAIYRSSSCWLLPLLHVAHTIPVALAVVAFSLYTRRSG